MDTFEIRIAPGGEIRYIYRDELRPLLAEGRPEVRRASHVEPDPDNPTHWLVDLRPSGGPVLRGFELRAKALRAEVEWLEAHNLGQG